MAVFRLGSLLGFFSPPSPPPPGVVNSRAPKLAALLLPATPSSGRTEITTLVFWRAEWRVRKRPSPPLLPVPSRRIKQNDQSLFFEALFLSGERCWGGWCAAFPRRGYPRLLATVRTYLRRGPPRVWIAPSLLNWEFKRPPSDKRCRSRFLPFSRRAGFQLLVW